MRPLEGLPPFDAVSGDELGLITRDAALRTGALTGLLVVRNATENQLDVTCAWGTVPSKDRLSLPVRRSGFVGRVLASGGTVGEPIISGTCNTNVAGGHEPLDASIGIAHWRAGMSADGFPAAKDRALRRAERVGGGTVVGAGDVAVGAGRGGATLREEAIRCRREPPEPPFRPSGQAVV